MRSLDGDGGPGALEGLLGLVRGVLVDALEDGLGGRVHEVLGLLEAEARERADLLDDLDLLVADRVEDDVELGLLLLGRAGVAAAGRGGRGNRDRSSGGDLEGLLELLHELGELDEGELLESLDELVGGELRHGWRPSWLFCPVLSTAWSRVGWGVPKPQAASAACFSRRASMVRAAWVAG